MHFELSSLNRLSSGSINSILQLIYIKFLKFILVFDSLNSFFCEFFLIERFGGDEFIVFIKKESFDDIVQLFEKLKNLVNTIINFPIHDGMMLTTSAC